MGRMPKAPFQPCIPTRGTKVPHHADWIHEIKQDGFRLIVQRDMDRVRLFTRNGYDWTSRYPLIVEAARRDIYKHELKDGDDPVVIAKRLTMSIWHSNTGGDASGGFNRRLIYPDIGVV
jgi:ATP-dependent DNA ligase